MENSVKKNYVYNTLYTVLSLIFPLITFPYVSRVLGPDVLGKVNFALVYTTYFVVFVLIVNPLYAIREIAFVKKDNNKLNQTFSELLFLGLIASVVVFLVYLSTYLFVGKVRQDPALFLIFGSLILFTGLSMEWLFQGLEQYKYITFRNIILKIISIVILFLLVRSADDYLWYAVVLVSVTIGSIVVNLITSGKYVHISFKGLNLKKHFKSMSIFYLITIVSAQGVYLDKLVLGFLKGDRAVGLYIVADKIITILLTLVASLSVVLLPRISYYFANDRKVEMYSKLDKSLKFILFLGFPVVVGLIFLAPEIIKIFGGEKYMESVLILKILSGKFFLIALANLLGLQMLVSMKKEKEYLISLFLGLLVSLVALFSCIHFWKIQGAAIGIVIGSFFQVLIQFWFNRTSLKEFAFKLENLIYPLASLVMGVLFYFITKINFSVFYVKLIVFTFSGFVIYMFVLFIFKEKLLFEIADNLKKKFFKK